MPPRFTAGGEVFNMDDKKKTDKGWKRAFDKDNSFNLILSRIGTLIIANILFVVGCIPIVTIGVSLSALNAVMFDFQRNDDVKVSSVFFKTYKENIISGIVGFILDMGFLSMGIVGLIISFRAENLVLMFIGFVIFGTITFAALCFLAFYFGIIARYENDLPTLVKNGLIVGIAYVRWGVLIWLLWILVIGSFYIFPVLLVYTGFVFAMLGFSFMAYVTTRIHRRVFRLVDDREVTDNY
jgi:uncharacterized membrane protein YesL